MRQSTIRALAVLSAVTVGAAGAVTGAAGTPSSAAAAARAAEHAPPPKHWDKRLEPIVKQVEQLRHLNFKHPVKATFLSEKAFRKRVAEDSSHLSEG